MGGVAKTEVSDDLRIGWPQQGLKDMTSMSGLRQGFPKENGLRQSCLTRLARRARGGLFALRVTRRGDLEACGFEARRLGE